MPSSCLQRLRVMVLRAPPALMVPAQPFRVLPILLMAQDPMSAPWGCQLLPQWYCSRADLQLPTALPCLAMGPAETGPPVGPHSSPASSCPCLQAGAQCMGLGLSRCPSAVLLLAGEMDRPWMPGPAITHTGSPWFSQHPTQPFPATFSHWHDNVVRIKEELKQARPIGSNVMVFLCHLDLFS